MPAPWYLRPPACMFAGMKLWPRVYMGSSGVSPERSPKSYWKTPRVSFGHDAGSAAMKRVVRPSRMLCLMNGNDMPPKLEPPPKHPITMSGYSPAFSICFSASRPMTVWWRATWLRTEPRTYLQFGVVMASSTASDIAVPSEPWLLGSRVRTSFPARVDIDGDGVTCAPYVSMMAWR